ncbi:MAG: 5-formyltetrahydrofolate cyclo-ligase [Planctomycetota bacterium]|nr:5-formyltetrahydrofolate cyclo-ligase [Planctomycetota bacterium]
MTVAAEPIETAKALLRTTVRGRLAAMTGGVREAESRAICDRAMDWQPLAAAGCVLAYMPMASEVDIRPMIETLLGRGVRVCLPRVEWESRLIVPVPIGDLERDLGPSERGVRQPRADIAPADADSVQVVVVPGLAFDDGGGRLGRGGGFYDRWLGDRADGVLALGVAFACQVVERVPMERHDRRVDGVVTPTTLLAAGGPGQAGWTESTEG